jgi:excisionase family DNA binding protein
MAFTIPQVCEKLGYSRQTVYHLISTGQLNACKPMNGHYRIWPEHLDEFRRQTECRKTHDSPDGPDAATGISASRRAAQHATFLHILPNSK